MLFRSGRVGEGEQGLYYRRWSAFLRRVVTTIEKAEEKEKKNAKVAKIGEEELLEKKELVKELSCAPDDTGKMHCTTPGAFSAETKHQSSHHKDHSSSHHSHRKHSSDSEGTPGESEEANPRDGKSTAAEMIEMIEALIAKGAFLDLIIWDASLTNPVGAAADFNVLEIKKVDEGTSPLLPNGKMVAGLDPDADRPAAARSEPTETSTATAVLTDEEAGAVLETARTAKPSLWRRFSNLFRVTS